MYYTIKTISDLLGITPQTIRYYEENGILAPIRDPNNNYRYYTVWDYAVLIFARRYVRYGCGLAESSSLLNDTPPQETIDMARRQELRLEEEIADRLRLLQCLREWRSRLEGINGELHRCHIGMRPGMFRLENMEDTSFIDEKEIYRLTKQWFTMTPFIFNTIRYPLDDVNRNTSHRISALGILEEDARPFGVAENTYIRYYPPRLCVISTIGGENFDTQLPLKRRIEGALAYLGEKKLTLTDDIITRMDFVQKQPDGYRSYQTAWLPID